MQLQDSRIQEAVTLIGLAQPGDHVIAPTRHAAEYVASAPELAELLRWSEVRAAAESYEDLDQRAIEAQRQFSTASSRAGIAVFLTGIFGALLLVVANFSRAPEGSPLNPLVLYSLLAVAVGGVIAGNLAAMWIYSIRAGGLFEQWKIRRAEAEAERLRYFELVTGPRVLSEPLLQLEYFRRYQFEMQRAIFRSRGRQHEAGADRALRMSSGALAAGGIMTGVAGVLAATLGPAWASLVLLALVAQAFGIRVENEEASAQHRRNAERFRRTRQTLDKLYGRLDAVRTATAAGERDALQDFVAAVHEQITIEHQEWQREIGAAGEAIDRLESVLEKHQEKLRQIPADNGRVVQVQRPAFRARIEGADRLDGAVTAVLPGIITPAEVALPLDEAIVEDAVVIEDHPVFEDDAGFEEVAEVGEPERFDEGARLSNRAGFEEIGGFEESVRFEADPGFPEGAGFEEAEGFTDAAEVEQAVIFREEEIPEEEEMPGR